MLFIYNNQPQVGKRGKKCRTGPDDHMNFPRLCPFPLVIFFPLGQGGIHHRHPLPEADIKPQKSLICQSNFRNQHDSLPSPPNHPFYHRKVNFRLSASCNPMNQTSISFPFIKIPQNGCRRFILLVTQYFLFPVILRPGIGRVRGYPHRIPVSLFRCHRNHTLLFQSLYRLRRNMEFADN